MTKKVQRKEKRSPNKSRARTLKPKKSLGQNFLTSQSIAEDIVRAADVGPDDIVLEAGPGKGILTEELLGKAKKVIAVEKDEKLVEFLREKFADRKNLEIIHADILDFDLKNHISKTKDLPAQAGYKIVANIPFYITSHFLRKFLQSDYQPSSVVLMIQKEVAERIIGLSTKRKKESILSISVKVYGEPKIIRMVSASHFLPKPKVDSAVILIDNISKNFFSNIDEENFFRLLKKGFSSKRKMLKNNLSLSNTEYLTKCGADGKVRAENLSPDNWKCLYRLLE